MTKLNVEILSLPTSILKRKINGNECKKKTKNKSTFTMYLNVFINLNYLNNY